MTRNCTDAGSGSLGQRRPLVRRMCPVPPGQNCWPARANLAHRFESAVGPEVRYRHRSTKDTPARARVSTGVETTSKLNRARLGRRNCNRNDSRPLFVTPVRCRAIRGLESESVTQDDDRMWEIGGRHDGSLSGAPRESRVSIPSRALQRGGHQAAAMKPRISAGAAYANSGLTWRPMASQISFPGWPLNA